MKKTQAIPLPDIGLDWLLARVKEDECGCFIWTGYMSAHGQPQARINLQLVLVRRLVWALVNGRDPAPAMWVTARCGTHGCVHPNCMVMRTRSAALKGRTTPMVVCAKISASRSKNSRFSAEAIRAMRSEPGTLIEVAARHGADPSYISQLRRNKARRDYASPFAGLGARK